MNPTLSPLPENPQAEIRIALAQISPTLGNRQKNHERHWEQINLARQGGADLIVFPELSLSGYCLRDQVPDVALPRTSAELAQLALVAGPAGLVLGFVEQSSQFRFYNSALFAENSRVQHVHRKVYLPTYGMFDEQRYFARGERIQAFSSPKFGRVGLLVCEDFWHLSAAVVLQAEEIDLLICIANSPARGLEAEVSQTSQTYNLLSRLYAQMLGVAVVLVNRTGYEDGLCFWGGSRVVAPDGSILAEAPMYEEALLHVTYSRSALRRQRILSPLGRDERWDLTLAELQRIQAAKFQ